MSNDEGLSWWQWRLLLVSALVFSGLLVYSMFDLVFLALGKSGTATVAEVYKMPSRRSDNWHMEFQYQDSAGHERKVKMAFGDSYDGPPVGAEFEIQYLPKWLLDAPDAARPKRPFNWIVLSLLLVASVGAGLFAYRAIYQPGEVRSSPRRR